MILEHIADRNVDQEEPAGNMSDGDSREEIQNPQADRIALAAEESSGQQERRRLRRAFLERRMTLLESEQACALNIKAAIEADPELDNLSDFWYAQLAIVNQYDLDTAKDHARSMQYFRQEYDIQDTIEDAKRTVWEFLNLFDNWVLSFGYSTDSQCYVWIIDMAAIDKKALASEKAWQINLAGHYYLRQALNPDFLSIRSGISVVHECLGFKIEKYGGTNHAKRLCQEVVGPYPAIHCSIKFFHTGTCACANKASNCRLLQNSYTSLSHFVRGLR